MNNRSRIDKELITVRYQFMNIKYKRWHDWSTSGDGCKLQTFIQAINANKCKLMLNKWNMHSDSYAFMTSICALQKTIELLYM